jgi:hypothetical protein
VPGQVDTGPSSSRLLVWRGLDEWRVEATSVALATDGLVATGTQIASTPVAYRLDYRLDACDNFRTRTLEIEVTGRGWSRDLALRRNGEGSWICDVRSQGSVALLPAPGDDLSSLDGALDCDLGLSPLTNAMPILRDGLHKGAGARDFLMAWVSVPDLAVVPSAQRYEHVERRADGSSVVRYIDRGEVEGFTADLELDADGLVVVYPGLAERIDDRI